MKITTKTFVIIVMVILSLISCSLRRKKNSKTKKLKRGNFDGSELDWATGRIAKIMCLQIGREATYIFFKNIDNYINNSLPDPRVYDYVFGRTFNNLSTEEKRTIQQKMVMVAEVALGGNMVVNGPAYWEQYSANMYRENQRYLDGLVSASKGNPAFKQQRDLVEAGANLASGGPRKIVESAGGVDGYGRMITELLIDITIYFIQRKMLNDARSNIFTESTEMNSFNQAINSRYGKCGSVPKASAEDGRYLHSPSYDGNLDLYRKR